MDIPIPEEIAKAAAQAEQEASAATAEKSCVRCGAAIQGNHWDLTGAVEDGFAEGPASPCCELCYHKATTTATCSRPDVVPVYSGPMPMTTIEDLEARLRMLMAAWVVQYEDGQLRIRFDTESRRQVEMAKVQTTAALVNF